MGNRNQSTRIFMMALSALMLLSVLSACTDDLQLNEQDGNNQLEVHILNSNPGFEEGGAGWDNDGNSAVISDDGSSKYGSNFLQMKQGTRTYKLTEGFAPEDTLVFSAYGMLTDDSEKPGVISIIALNEWGGHVQAWEQKLTFTETEWTEYSTTFEVPKMANALLINVSYDGSDAHFNVDDVSVVLDMPEPLPGGNVVEGWTSQDIGGVAISGAAAVEDDTFTVSASGTDIWNVADEFHYMYKKADDAFTMTARVKSIKNTDEWAKAGIMLREDLNADSKNIYIASKPAGATLQIRNQKAANTVSFVDYEDVEPTPRYIKLVRSGEQFWGYNSLDGENWTLHEYTHEVTFGDAYIGLAVTSHNNGELTTAVLDQVEYKKLEGAPPEFVKKPEAGGPPATVEPNEFPAFPGAEGFGAGSVGGRGGEVIEVTNLNDSGPGSLRAAVEATGERIVVFKVAGTIELESNISTGSENSYLTIAGQTAPGDGIQLKNWTINFGPGTHDVIVQNLRFRPGHTGVHDWSKSAVMVHGSKLEPAYNIIFDHCSFYYGPDENIGIWGNVYFVTVQRSITAKGIFHDYAEEPRTEGSRGAIVGSAEDSIQASGRYVTLHHNYFAHGNARNPLIKNIETHFINNVIYNYGAFGTEISALNGNDSGKPYGVKANLIGNYFKAGKDTYTNRYEIGIDIANPDEYVYVGDNISPHRLDESVDDWAMVVLNSGDPYWQIPAPEALRKDEPWPDATIPVTIDPSSEVVEDVLNDVGVRKPVVDSLDQAVIDDFYSNIGRILLGTPPMLVYPDLESGEPYKDSDKDGMPDDWEKEHDLDATDPADGNSDKNEDGYTNIEAFLYEITP